MKQINFFSSSLRDEVEPGKLNTKTSSAAACDDLVSDKPAQRKRRDLLPNIDAFFDGELQHYPDFLTAQTAQRMFQRLRSQVSWQSERIKVYGQWHQIPRLQAWYGDSQSSYSYSGKTLQPQPLTEELEALKKACSKIAKIEFNSVLANLYRNGDDSMGLHSDDEPELGYQPVIASVTLGATRRFDLLHKKHPCKLQLFLQSGSLLIMKGDTQKYWQHGIARTKQPVGERINLTFRRVKK